MRQIAEFVAVIACGLFTGAALYVSFVEHPARMECGVEIAVIEFPPSYRRATVMQAILRGAPRRINSTKAVRVCFWESRRARL